MENLPFSYQLKARVSGISALYALFTIGCLVVSICAPVLFPRGILQYFGIFIGLLFFFGLIVFGCYIICRKPERFYMKEEIAIKVEIVHRSVKPLDGEPIVSISEPSSPPILPKSESQEEM